MKLKNKTELMILIGTAISIIFAFFYPSISLGLILGYVYAYANFKLVYKSLHGVLQNQEGTKPKISISNQLLRLGLLIAFLTIAIYFRQYFHIVGIGIGMALALVGLVLDSKKEDNKK